MADRAGLAKNGAHPVRGAKMTIRYKARNPKRGRERRVVYLRYGEPPVTPVEIEIMHQHLESLVKGDETRNPELESSR